MKNLINTIILIFCWVGLSYGIELVRISPEKSSISVTNVQVKFSLSVNDTKGLTYSKWQISGKLQDKHILTGYAVRDEWRHSFYREGTYYVSVVVYNIVGNSQVLIWKVKIQNEKGKAPYIAVLNPTSSSLSVDEGNEVNFRIEISDDNCELDKIEWLVDGEVKESNPLNGCKSTGQFYYSFYSVRNYEVCANVYNRSGSKEVQCWNVNVSKKTGKNYANNYSSGGSNNKSSFSSSTATPSKKSFVGFSYSTRTLISTQEFEGNTFGDFFQSSPTSYELSFRSNQGVIGGQVAIWQMSGDFKHDLGSFSQTGVRAEFLINLGTDSTPLGFNIYLGGGGVYQKGEFELLGEKQENDGYGYSYLGGLEIIVNQTFVVFAEYNGITSTSGRLEVGSTGLAIGAGLKF